MKNSSQKVQYLMKQYCEKFFPQYDPTKFYTAWKKQKGIESVTKLEEQERQYIITELATAIMKNTIITSTL